ncbi:MAG: TonB family protein, partial [Pseudomonadota bacterium]|nr:TonB family protein [Pseudomonadota bacterium]
PPLRFLQGAMPTYPTAAKAAGREGWVRVRYAVGADGAVLNPQVLEASPEGVFDAAARAAVARWRYAPDPRGLGWEGVESVVRFELGERVLP